MVSPLRRYRLGAGRTTGKLSSGDNSSIGNVGMDLELVFHLVEGFSEVFVIRDDDLKPAVECFT